MVSMVINEKIIYFKNSSHFCFKYKKKNLFNIFFTDDWMIIQIKTFKTFEFIAP